MVNNTIFDDVFRTMLEKMPELIVPVINEIFGTEYPMDIPLEQLRNEHQTRSGERITDSYFRIGNKGYHIECQSTDDSEMVIRMVEYDFAISLENVEGRLLELIKKITDYIFEKQDSVRKGIGDIMGGKVLELQTDKALEEGREEGVRAFVESYQEDGMSKEQVSLRLMKKFHLTESESQIYINKYWKE